MQVCCQVHPPSASTPLPKKTSDLHESHNPTRPGHGGHVCHPWLRYRCKYLRVCLRSGASVENSPEVANSAGAVISSSSITATMMPTTMRDAPNLPITDSKAPTSQTLFWPLAAHASMQPMSQKALETAVGMATTQVESTTEEHYDQSLTKAVGIQEPMKATLGAYGGLGKRRIVTVNKTTSIAPLQCTVTQAGGKTVAMPRCLILRPVCTAASTNSLRLGMVTGRGPNTHTVTGGTNKLTAENKQHILIPAVHTTVRQIRMPRVIPQASFSIPASTPGCRVIRAKTVAVPRLQSPLASSTSNLQALPVIGSPASSQLTAATDTGKDSPLSCIQTLVANTGAAMELIAANNKVPDYNGSAVSQTDSDEDDAVLEHTVSANNRESSGFANMAFDNTIFKQASCSVRKRLSMTDDFENRVAKQS